MRESVIQGLDDHLLGAARESERKSEGPEYRFERFAAPVIENTQDAQREGLTLGIVHEPEVALDAVGKLAAERQKCGILGFDRRICLVNVIDEHPEIRGVRKSRDKIDITQERDPYYGCVAVCLDLGRNGAKEHRVDNDCFGLKACAKLVLVPCAVEEGLLGERAFGHGRESCRNGEKIDSVTEKRSRKAAYVKDSATAECDEPVFPAEIKLHEILDQDFERRQTLGIVLAIDRYEDRLDIVL